MNGPDRSLVLSYLGLRRLIGAVGVLLPVILAGYGFIQCRCLALQPSLSQYYDLGGRVRDLFVGVLIAIATFLWSYRGYETRDLVAARLASACALAVALFPQGGTALERSVHLGAALILFAVFAYFSLVLFTTSAGTPTREKQVRNKLYTVCGVTILVCLLLMILIGLFVPETTVDNSKIIFWLETVTLWTFGLSWSVKGGALLRDSAGSSPTQEQ